MHTIEDRGRELAHATVLTARLLDAAVVRVKNMEFLGSVTDEW